MRIETSDSAAMALVLMTLIIAITVILIVYLKYDSRNTIAFVAHGYTRATLPGSACPQWVKETR